GGDGGGESLVGRHDDNAYALHRVARDEKGVAIFWIGVADVSGDVANLLAIGPCAAHAVLHAAHLGGGDHLHRLGDLPGVLHTPDFHPYFFGSRHFVSSG